MNTKLYNYIYKNYSKKLTINDFKVLKVFKRLIPMIQAWLVNNASVAEDWRIYIKTMQNVIGIKEFSFLKNLYKADKLQINKYSQMWLIKVQKVENWPKPFRLTELYYKYYQL